MLFIPVFSASLSRSSSHYVHFFPHHIRVADGSAPRATRSERQRREVSGSEGAPPYGLRHEEKSEESSECKERRDERMKRALFLHSLLTSFSSLHSRSRVKRVRGNVGRSLGSLYRPPISLSSFTLLPWSPSDPHESSDKGAR